MSHLLDDDDDLGSQRDRELTLSTGSILGIFFGLVVLCGIFFAFGYSMGHRKSAPLESAGAAETGSAAPSANFGTFKPAAGSPAGSAPSSVAAPATTSPGTVRVPISQPSAPSPAPASQPVTNTPPPQPAAPVVRATPPPVPVAGPNETPNTATGAGFFMVQVAAVSHKEDADLLLSALKTRGYSVMARTYSGDPLIHIQLGPYNNRKDAEAMRARLLNDGYNAILK